MLEFRTHAKAYQISSEITEEWPCADVYFIGIRIRYGVEINKDEVDLTGTRQRFFEQINELLAMKQNPYIEDLVEN